MSRKNKTIKNQAKSADLLNQILVLPINILVAIGELVRWFIAKIIYLFYKSYNFIVKNTFRLLRYYRKTLVNLSTWRLSHLKLPTIKKPVWPKLKIKLPAIRLPDTTLPVLPKINFSLQNLPRLHFNLFPFFTKKKQKKQLRLPSVEKVKLFFIGVLATLIFVFLPYNAYQLLKTLPSPTLLTRRDLEVTTKILDRNGVLLYEIYADQNRTPLPLAQIPDYVKQATIAIEDRDFYKHNGVSLRGIIRAARETFVNKRVQGGSTITQQLIKSALLSPEIKVSRKLKEIFLAWWAERFYSKNQILEMYLNQVPYGGTAWGVEAASQTYFGKSANNLNLAQAALLAGLPAAPTQYSPFGNHPEQAFERQREVLRRMLEDHYITKAQAEEALATPLQIQQPRIAIRAPHFVMYVRDLLEKRYGTRLVEKGGLRIITSLDIAMQEKTEDTVKNNLEGLASLLVGNAAVVITNPKTGEILTMVGSRDYFNVIAEGNVNVATSLQQPGSAIKVVNYAAALENGFTAASILDDSPVVYNYPGSPAYAPVNYDGKFHGFVPLRYALGNSYNIPAVKVLAKIGVKSMIAKGRLMGIETWKDESQYGLSLTLGGGEVTMLEMAKVFGTLANSGKRQDLLPVLEVSDYTGKIYEKNSPKRGVEAVKPETAWILNNILADNYARTNAFGPSSSLVIPGKTVSVKTGTSNDKRDNWTIGYTHSYVVTVWVGNNDNSPMHPLLTSGVTGAAPIWHDVMADLLKDKLNELTQRPENVIAVPCYFGRDEFFVKGTEPAFGRCAPLPTPSPSPSPTP